jgi:hypothetical protein
MKGAGQEAAVAVDSPLRIPEKLEVEVGSGDEGEEESASEEEGEFSINVSAVRELEQMHAMQQQVGGRGCHRYCPRVRIKTASAANTASVVFSVMLG